MVQDFWFHFMLMMSTSQRILKLTNSKTPRPRSPLYFFTLKEPIWWAKTGDLLGSIKICQYGLSKPLTLLSFGLLSNISDSSFFKAFSTISLAVWGLFNRLFFHFTDPRAFRFYLLAYYGSIYSKCYYTNPRFFRFLLESCR